MAENFLIVTTVAAVLGFLSGLGVGGGTLLLLWLTMIVRMDAATARIINLLFFIPSAAVSCAFHKRKGTLRIRRVIPAAVCGCTGAVVGSFASGILDSTVLKQAFGILLLTTGIREFFYSKKKQAS